MSDKKLTGLAAKLATQVTQSSFEDSREWVKVEASEMELLAKSNGAPMLEIITKTMDGVAITKRLLITDPSQKVVGGFIPSTKYVKKGDKYEPTDEFDPQGFYPMMLLLSQLKADEIESEGDEGIRISRIKFPGGMQMKSLLKMENELAANAGNVRRANRNANYAERTRRERLAETQGFFEQPQVQQPTPTPPSSGLAW